MKCGFNSLVGPIPPEIGNLTQLFFLVLSGNSFSGHIPPELSRLTLLQGLGLHSNALEGPIPENIFELTRLTVLRLELNRFTGPISTSISKLEMLSDLDLHGNALNGSIPTSMEHLVRLMSLDLSHNHLTGSIPGSVMGKMKSMQIFLNLSYNLLDGNIPQELGMLEAVQAIDLSNNNLSGIIPKTLGGCRNLFSLDLSGNKLSGSIPAEALVQMSMLSRINLSRNDLNGQIPEKLAELKHLSALDLSRNQLEGIIPYSFGNLSSLKHLNLSFNHLEGRVPESGLFKNISSSSLAGNPALCGTKSLKSCSKKNSHTFSKKTVLILLAIGVVSIVLVLSVVIPLVLQRAKKKKTTSTENTEPEFTAALKLIRYDRNEIENATSFFSEENIIGSSSLSTVYKGQLEDGKTIAVKQLNVQKFSAESDKCFYREIKTLSQLRHRNLVKVLGYAWESPKLKVLVLEYMQNGSLESIIHNPQVDQSWGTLSERINVCVSIASALEYLHSGYDFPIVHCDLKPSNVLLDGDWVAHVSDFGTARILGVHLPDGNSLSSASAFEGTIGYMAPEFAYMRRATPKVDVFSFGVVVMEVLVKRRPTGLTDKDGLPISLRQLVERALANGIDGLLQVLDPVIAKNLPKEEEALEQLFQIAFSCTNPNPEDRPDMKEVLSCLQKISAR